VEVKIEDFTLMVFDECHHAHANHAYTQIMDKYMDLKFDENIHRQGAIKCNENNVTHVKTLYKLWLPLIILILV
jgi:hypothetical protein